MVALAAPHDSPPALPGASLSLAPRPAPARAHGPEYGVSYAEVRMWARWLDVFTPSELADVMLVDVAVAERFVRALLWHGICTDTGERLPGEDGGDEAVIGYVPLPPGPREHHTRTPPEALVGYTDVVNQRGMPIRIRTERMLRRSLSTPGARQAHKNRERAYQRAEEAKAARAKAQAERDDTPKWAKKAGPKKAIALARARKRLARAEEEADF